MWRELFLRIVRTLEAFDLYFQMWRDRTGRLGLSPLTKCTVALRQLAYGTTMDMFEEYLHIGDLTGRECQSNFCQVVVEAFSTTYMRKPNATDCPFLLDMHERVHGFPRMLGSIDCMHWE
ncbi:hypothetical protein AAHA92_06908 [Salvia divinorum]|uniref:Uncharacterized protein n=1 Tax=Salvia divinorum TaxID=28513 RepID=A0ABD1I7Y3_SALDI